MAEQGVRIQTTLMPRYYKDFQCLAAGCQDTCCQGWRIEFDKKDYLKLRDTKAPAELKARLDGAVGRVRNDPTSTMYARFQMDKNGGVCPLQDPDGLCALQRACGHGALPTVCQTYPRSEKWTVAAHEFSLSPTCEGVLALLWDLPEGVDFVEEPLPRNKLMYPEQAEVEGTVWKSFPEIRSLCVDILQARQFSLAGRLILMGLSLQELMEQDWNAPDVEGWCARTAARLEDPAMTGLLASLPGDQASFLTQNIGAADMLQKSEKSWAKELHDAMGISIGFDSESMRGGLSCDFSRYDVYKAAFVEKLGDREYFFENLMVAVLMYQTLPVVETREKLWKGYVNLCSIYSFFRFAAVVGCGAEPTRERLFHYLVLAGRALLHDDKRRAAMQETFFQNHSATLAHMAVLVSE